ncbi:hypothetical protein TREMEDRAFT_45798 [Tremella mesenterica DSM 1558]|uniref:uncharacterized protein n=1 Tax=Tremella mesenterica (strain ATCC 24925 / CBS 8224 / DSM 1558 / NBRC 9311 / NRRL Y-6157 / RJB 2259-6 / UBC 559-6) TaxID=578456 RepID=UPI00032BED8F|nr:uncharacterized protein TREMEDRAFT_45798 [Tremella mesenterica DSM 1558]EIW66327.1 hypothetical protein TREMEDRAFT_45798 [Tremella mesenterica DSM 1558]
MRFLLSAITTALLGLIPLALASDIEHWVALAQQSKDGIIKLNSESYEELVGGTDREYSAVVVLTALGTQFKCQPCHNFDPSVHQVAASWKRLPKYVRDQHIFAQLDFADGQAIYQKLGLTSAPTVQFHPALSGPNKGNKLSVITYDLPRNGLDAAPFHSFLSPLTPIPFDLHKPFNPIPLIITLVTLVVSTAGLYSLYPYIIPIVQSRVFWGVTSIMLVLTFTSGHMWNRIKNAPYTSQGQDGSVSWIAGGFQNQLGMESQVVGAIYGLLAFSIISLTLFVPSQTSPAKQRVGVYLWLGMLIVVFSLLMKLFRMKNGGYPFSLLF